MNATVCVDASVLIKLVVEEPGSDRADRLWASWIQEDVQVIIRRPLSGPGRDEGMCVLDSR